MFQTQRLVVVIFCEYACVLCMCVHAYVCACVCVCAHMRVCACVCGLDGVEQLQPWILTWCMVIGSLQYLHSGLNWSLDHSSLIR